MVSGIICLSCIFYAHNNVQPCTHVLGLFKGAPEHSWAAEWLPMSVWRMIASETNSYWKTRIEGKKKEAEDQNKPYKPDATDMAIAHHCTLPYM
jgi:hypothetical protein